MKSFLSLSVFLVIVFSISAIGSAYTVPEIDGWYLTLNKPPFNPPDWVFAPVWTALYCMIAVSGWRVWNRLNGAFKEKIATPQIKIYAAQLIANCSWSIAFFGMHNIELALAVIYVLLGLIFINIALFKRIDRLAAWLLAPYFFWVSFASVLNLTIVRLN